ASSRLVRALSLGHYDTPRTPQCAGTLDMPGSHSWRHWRAAQSGRHLPAASAIHPPRVIAVTYLFWISTRSSDTPQGLKPHGFSVHPPSPRRASPKALSEPLDISGRVLVAVQDESAGGTDVDAYAQGLLNARPTA